MIPDIESLQASIEILTLVIWAHILLGALIVGAVLYAIKEIIGR